MASPNDIRTITEYDAEIRRRVGEIPDLTPPIQPEASSEQPLHPAAQRAFDMAERARIDERNGTGPWDSRRKAGHRVLHLVDTDIIPDTTDEDTTPSAESRRLYMARTPEELNQLAVAMAPRGRSTIEKQKANAAAHRREHWFQAGRFQR